MRSQMAVRRLSLRRAKKSYYYSFQFAILNILNSKWRRHVSFLGQSLFEKLLKYLSTKEHISSS